MFYKVTCMRDERKNKIVDDDRFWVENMQPIFSTRETSNERVLSWLVEYDDMSKKPEKPVYISGQILAYSRVVMSRYMSAAGCYSSLDQLYYTHDTDSLLLGYSSFFRLHCNSLIAQDGRYRLFGCIGNELGQLKDEYPMYRIRSVINLAPKLYFLVLEHRTTLKRYWRVRAKGIPHTSALIPADEYDCEYDKEKHSLKNKMVDHYALWDSEGNLVQTRPCLTKYFFEMCLEHGYSMSVHFTSFKRIIFDPKNTFNDGGSSSISESNMSRFIHGNRWWKEGHCRVPSEDNFMSYPVEEY